FREEIAAGRVIVYAKGVWDKDDVLPLFEDPDNSAADSFIIVGKNDTARNIPLTTIDKLAVELKLPRVDVIKMDIKGATQKALTGARVILAQYKPRIVISTEEEPDQPVDVARHIASFGLGYRVECGICSVNSRVEINPNVLFFR